MNTNKVASIEDLVDLDVDLDLDHVRATRRYESIDEAFGIERSSKMKVNTEVAMEVTSIAGFTVYVSTTRLAVSSKTGLPVSSVVNDTYITVYAEYEEEACILALEYYTQLRTGKKFPRGIYNKVKDQHYMVQDFNLTFTAKLGGCDA